MLKEPLLSIWAVGIKILKPNILKVNLTNVSGFEGSVEVIIHQDHARALQLLDYNAFNKNIRLPRFQQKVLDWHAFNKQTTLFFHCCFNLKV